MTSHRVIRILARLSAKWRRIILVGTLLLITLVLLLWHQWGMNRHLRIEPAHFNALPTSELISDGAGLSRSHITPQGDGWRVDCELILSKRLPYCGLDLFFKPAKEGINLSQFDSVRIRYHYAQPAQHLRVSLFNFSPKYSHPDDYLSNKIEDVVLLPRPDWQEQSFSLWDFNVPTWWILQRGALPKEAGVEFDRVVQMRIVTGYDVQAGKQQFTIAWIEFTGKWINAANLRLLLLFMWLFAGFIGLLWEWRSDVSKLRSSRQRQKWLENTNLLLTQETQLLADRVRVDPLTKICNREGLANFLAQHCQSQDQPISLIFLDIDHFKKINDAHGHAVGDAVLQQFANEISQQIRATDCLVRWGGEEFLLLSIKTNLAGAAGLAEKIRASLAHVAWPNGITVSCSAGVAEMAADEAFASVTQRADTALYQAKAAGRNRIEIAVFPQNSVDISNN